jgi:hypothetical protein
MKQHWVIPSNDSVTVKKSKKGIYPVNLIFHGHSSIEEMEVQEDNYIKVKINGKWTMIYLPRESTA